MTGYAGRSNAVLRSEAAMTAAAETPAPDHGESLLRRHIASFMQSRVAVGALALLVALVAAAILAPLYAPQNPYDLAQLDIMDNMLRPGGKLASGVTAWLGTDDQGQIGRAHV